jgi:hypothetical protein
MVSTDEKGPTMLVSVQHNESLDEIRELNSLFVDFLRTRALTGMDCLGLGKAAVQLLRSAEDSSLELLREFPRALFRMHLDACATNTTRALAHGDDISRYTLHLAMLHSARTMSNRRPQAARVFLGLGAREVEWLRVLPLGSLPAVATGPLVSCAFREAPWLWPKMFTATRPEMRHQLVLLALQPNVSSPETCAPERVRLPA